MTLKYLLKKLLYGITVLWGVITLVFVLFNVLPDDPAKLTLGQRSDLSTLENVRKELNLDQPTWKRYAFYLNDLSPISVHQTESLSDLKYNYTSLISASQHEVVIKKPYLGRSYQTKRLVWDVLADALPGTLLLAFSAIVIATLGGIALGTVAALKKGTFWDTSAILTSVMGISTPSFFAGLIIAYMLGYVLHDWTNLNMVGSLWTYDATHGKQLQLKNLILPAITLGIRPMAIIAQLTRNALLDVLTQDYIRTAYAKGVPKTKVILKHALPNAMIPVVTAITGWLAELLSGSFFIEFIFSWKGIGKLTVDSLDKLDFPVVMGAIIISAAIFVIINLITDIIYTKIDPRIQLR